jgi:hypothetical protein
MASIDIRTAPTLLQSIVQGYFMSKSIYLGLITSANKLDPNLIETTASSFVLAEYNSGSWVRPSFIISSPGSFDTTQKEWDLPSSAKWTFVGPVGGITIAQVVITIGGTSAPRNTSGVIIGVGTYATPLVVGSGATQVIEAPWSIR